MLAFDGQEVVDSRRLDRAALLSIGQTMQLSVWRDGSIRTVPVTVEEYPQDVWASYKNENMKEVVFTKISDAGILVSDLTKELRDKFGLNDFGDRSSIAPADYSIPTITSVALMTT